MLYKGTLEIAGFSSPPTLIFKARMLANGGKTERCRSCRERMRASTKMECCRRSQKRLLRAECEQSAIALDERDTKTEKWRGSWERNDGGAFLMCFLGLLLWSLPSNHSNGLSYCSLLHSAAREIRNWPLIAFFYIAASNTYKASCRARRVGCLSLSLKIYLACHLSLGRARHSVAKKPAAHLPCPESAEMRKMGLETFCLRSDADVLIEICSAFRRRKGDFNNQKTCRAGCILVTFKAFSLSHVYVLIQGGIAVFHTP